jgi:vWA found in TerF C terminus/TerD domain
MASVSLAGGGVVPVDSTDLRVELSRVPGHGTRGAGAQAPAVSAVLLDPEGRTVGRSGPGAGSRTAQDGEEGERTPRGPQGRESAVDLDLRALPARVARVVLCLRADGESADGGAPDGGGSGRAAGLLLRLLDAPSGTELVRFPMPADAGTDGAVVVGELRRTGGGWTFHAVVRGCAQDPAATAGARGAARVPQQRGGPAAGEGAAATGPARPAPTVGRLALRREQVAASLGKYGAAGARARVVLVLDASGSTAALYSRGAVADVVERAAAVAAELGAGEDAVAHAWTFASHPARLPDLAVADLPRWLALHVRTGELSFLGRPRKRRRGLHPDQVDMRLVGIQNEEQKAVAQVRAYVRDHPVPGPTLVLFFSNGGVHRNAEIEKQLAGAAEEPLFWQFAGLRRADYGVLARFGTGHGRRADHVGFFAVDDIARTSDAELYDRLLSCFPPWLARARRDGVLG